MTLGRFQYEITVRVHIDQGQKLPNCHAGVEIYQHPNYLVVAAARLAFQEISIPQ